VRTPSGWPARSCGDATRGRWCGGTLVNTAHATATTRTTAARRYSAVAQAGTAHNLSTGNQSLNRCRRIGIPRVDTGSSAQFTPGQQLLAHTMPDLDNPVICFTTIIIAWHNSSPKKPQNAQLTIPRVQVQVNYGENSSREKTPGIGMMSGDWNYIPAVTCLTPGILPSNLRSLRRNAPLFKIAPGDFFTHSMFKQVTSQNMWTKKIPGHKDRVLFC
jgi:hypothetical protein